MRSIRSLSRLCRAFGLFALALSCRDAASQGLDCQRQPLDDIELESLGLSTTASIAQPGESVHFAFGLSTRPCRFFPVRNCVKWSVDPPDSAVVVVPAEDVDASVPFEPTGTLKVNPSTPHGTVITLAADVDSGRRLLKTRIHVYSAEEGPPTACTTGPLDEFDLQNLTLETRRSAQPGASVPITLGVWRCCVFVMPIHACVDWTVEPADMATLAVTEDICTIIRTLKVNPAAPHGTVIRVLADIESGRKLLRTEVHVYTPEANPLVGFWRETSQVPCTRFIRGDIDANGGLNIADAVRILSFLFDGGAEVGCRDSADANGNASVDISDAVFALNFLFSDGLAPPAPFPDCGNPPVESGLGCASFESCPRVPFPTPTPIEELVFEADSTFSVTWTPFEVYRDYWGTYSYDLETGSLEIRVDSGNYVPEDVRCRDCTFSIDEKLLSLDGLWFGSPRRGQERSDVCGHRFERR